MSSTSHLCLISAENPIRPILAIRTYDDDQYAQSAKKNLRSKKKLKKKKKKNRCELVCAYLNGAPFNILHLSTLELAAQAISLSEVPRSFSKKLIVL